MISYLSEVRLCCDSRGSPLIALHIKMWFSYDFTNRCFESITAAFFSTEQMTRNYMFFLITSSLVLFYDSSYWANAYVYMLILNVLKPHSFTGLYFNIWYLTGTYTFINLHTLICFLHLIHHHRGMGKDGCK